MASHVVASGPLCPLRTAGAAERGARGARIPPAFSQRAVGMWAAPRAVELSAHRAGRAHVQARAEPRDGESAPRYIGWQGRTDVPDELQRWQEIILDAALQLPKSKLDVKAVARETKLERKEVLAWMKANRSRVQRAPADNNVVEKRWGGGDAGGGEDGDEYESLHVGREDEGDFEEMSVKRSTRKKERGLRSTNMASTLSGHEPAWVRSYAEKRISAEVEKTLEAIYRRNNRPSDDVIAGIQELTGLSKRRTKDWFIERRDRR